MIFEITSLLLCPERISPNKEKWLHLLQRNPKCVEFTLMKSTDCFFKNKNH